MKFEKIEDIERIKVLKKQSRFIDEELDTDVYILSDEDDVKTIVVLKRVGDYLQPISTVRQLDIETLKHAQGKGFASKGFEAILEEVMKREDISELRMDAVNPLSNKIVSHYDIESELDGIYSFKNPNFNPNYDVVCQMIRDNTDFELVQDFCANNNLSQDQVKKWLEIQKRLPEIEPFSSDIPTFEPPESTGNTDFQGIDSLIDKPYITQDTQSGKNEFEIDKNGEIVRPSTLASLAVEKAKLEHTLTTRQTELENLKGIDRNTKDR